MALFLLFTYDTAKYVLCGTSVSPHAHRFIYLTVLDFWHQFCTQWCTALYISYIVAHIEAGCKRVPISYFFSLWKPRNERNYASNKKSRLKGKRSAALLKRPTVIKELRPLFSPLYSECLACTSVHAAGWSLFPCLCVCVCARMCMRAHICVGNDEKDVEWYVAVYLGNLVGLYCAFGPVYVLLTLMFFYCALRAHVRLYGKYTFTTLLHHITIPITNCYASSRSIQSCTCSYVISWKMMANMVMNFTPVLLFNYQIHRASTLWGMASLH